LAGESTPAGTKELFLRTTEIQFVEFLRKEALRHSRGLAAGLRRGIGDDCAVIAQSSKNDLLVTTDLFLEGVHFRREWQDPRSAGHKSLARGLSDIAAMGGIPRFAFLSLGLPRRMPAGWVEEFFKGFFKLARRERVVLAGGDTGRAASGVVADIILVGEAPRGESILRSGARVGDELWVTGRLGEASVGLELLERKGGRQRKENGDARNLRKFFYPQPRCEIGRFLRERRLASAMIDLSDGLSIDLARLCKESGVGARIEEAAIPRARGTPLRSALHGGEDFELLFTVPRRKAHLLPATIAGVRLTRIGRIIPRKPGKKAEHNLFLVRQGKESPLPVLGFQHF
jgi:thiamine-monophosphate kinase